MSEPRIHELTHVAKVAKEARLNLSRKLAQGDYAVGVLAAEISDARVIVKYVGNSIEQVEEALKAQKLGDPSHIERHAYVHLTLGAWDGEHERLKPLADALEKYVLAMGLDVDTSVYQGARVTKTEKGKERRDAYVEVDILNPSDSQIQQLQHEFAVIGRGVEEPLIWF